MAVGLIRRGDILLVNFAPAREGEANYTWPAVVVTNNAANANAPVLMVVPLTTNLERMYSIHLLLPYQRTGLNEDSKAQPEALRAISLSRVLRRLGHVPEDLMAQLDDRIRLHLAL